jgi:hypothetical protein
VSLSGAILLCYNDLMLIPDSIRALLWEYDVPKGPAGPEWDRAIVERVMSRGRLDDMRWLVATFDRPALTAYLQARGARVLPPRELRFWSTWCGVPSLQANAWVRSARARETAWRG